MLATPPPLPQPRKRRRWAWWKILLLAVGIPLGLVLLLVSCGFFYELTAKDLPVEEGDRAALVTADTLRPWMSETFDPARGTTKISKRRYLDGSHTLEYEFEYEADEEYLYIGCTLNHERSIPDAKTLYTMSKAGSKIGVSLEDVELRSRNDLFRWGETSECSLMVMEDGRELGNHFIGRKGTRVFDVSISGIYWDQGDDLKELLGPVLRAAETWRP